MFLFLVTSNYLSSFFLSWCIVNTSLDTVVFVMDLQCNECMDDKLNLASAEEEVEAAIAVAKTKLAKEKIAALSTLHFASAWIPRSNATRL